MIPFEGSPEISPGGPLCGVRTDTVGDPPWEILQRILLEVHMS